MLVVGWVVSFAGLEGVGKGFGGSGDGEVLCYGRGRRFMLVVGCLLGGCLSCVSYDGMIPLLLFVLLLLLLLGGKGRLDVGYLPTCV